MSPPGPSELSGSARGAVPGEGPGAAPQAPRAGRGLQSPAPPSRRLRARLPARGAAMGAAPCGAAPASPRPFRPREPARDRGTAGVPPPAAGLALLGGRGPDEVSCAALRIIPNSGFCRTSLWTRYIHKKKNIKLLNSKVKSGRGYGKGVLSPPESGSFFGNGQETILEIGGEPAIIDQGMPVAISRGLENSGICWEEGLQLFCFVKPATDC